MDVVNENSTIFRRHYESKALHLVNSAPTHHTLWHDGSSHDTWLDLFLLKDAERLIEYSKSSDPFTVGHDLIEIIYSIDNPPPAPQIISSRCLNRLSSADVCHSLSSSLSSVLPAINPTLPPATADASQHIPCLSTTTSDADLICSRTTAALNATFDHLAPVKTFISAPNKKPWVTADIRTLMTQRRKLFKRAQILKTPEAVHEYRSKRNEVSSCLTRAKDTFIAARVDRAASATAKWRELRKLGIGARKAPSPLQRFSPDTLNQHFASVCTNAPPLSDVDVCVAATAPLLRPGISTFNLERVDYSTVARILSSQSSNSLGVDGISSSMLKLASPTILPHIVDIINASFETASFPAEWKRALIVPLSKVPCPKSPTDTRPIALLCEMSKILERVVHEQLLKHLASNNLLDPFQSGFRAHHSTQTTLLGISEQIREAIDRRKITALLAFDFSKAFDTLSHARLLRKLRQIGCSLHSLNWFASYLRDRMQAVKDSNGQPSTWISISTGVPQGSVLGPLLFSIFMLDLPAVLTHSRYAIYADDTQIFQHSDTSAESLAVLVSKLTEDASAVVRWSAENGLLLNPKKTIAMLFGSQAYVTKLDITTIPRVKVGAEYVPFSESMVNLGVVINRSLNWEEHINRISARVYAALHTLRRYSRALSRTLRKNLVESLIFPHFDYACAVYHDLTYKQNERLHRLLNACIRFVYGSIPWMAHVTPYRLALGWLSVKRRREYFIGNLAFKVSKFNSPSYLADRLVPTHERPDLRRSRRTASEYFLVPSARTESLARSFSHCAARLVNSLPVQDFSELSVPAFKSLLWDTLFTRDLKEWVERSHFEGLIPIPSALQGQLTLPSLILPRL